VCVCVARAQLEHLSISGEEQMGAAWVTGLDAIPGAWSSLTRLTSLELRCHGLLEALPAFMEALPLRRLDVSMSRALSLDIIPRLTGLEALVLQVGCASGSAPFWKGRIGRTALAGLCSQDCVGRQFFGGLSSQDCS
jgi:hypothetical protein